MNIFDFLKSNGMSVKDILVKVKNKQIKLNDKTLFKHDLKSISFEKAFDAGEFVFNNIKSFENFRFLSLDEMFSCDIPCVRKTLKGKSFLRVSKKQMFILT